MRFLAVYARTLWDRKISWPMVAGSVILYVLMIVGIYPSFANNPAFSEIIKSYPKEVLSLLAGSSGVNMMSPEGFISMEFLQLWGMIIIAGFAMATATAIVAREIDNHTMDIMLAQPLDRVEYLTAKLAADLTMIFGLVAVTIGSIWVGTKLFDFKLDIHGILAVSVPFACLIIMIECYSLFLGTIMERGKAISVAIAILLVSHLWNALGDFNKTIEGMRWVSFMYYYNPAEALKTGEIPWGPVLLFIGVAVVFLTAAVVVFRERDIAA